MKLDDRDIRTTTDSGPRYIYSPGPSTPYGRFETWVCLELRHVPTGVAVRIRRTVGAGGLPLPDDRPFARAVLEEVVAALGSHESTPKPRISPAQSVFGAP